MKPSESNSMQGSSPKKPLSALTTEAALTPEKLEALADVSELLSLAFSFPYPELVEALTSGTFQADLCACLEVLGISPATSATLNELGCNESPQDLHVSLKREYSRLYLSPGKLAVIYPYESAFLFVKQGGEGPPTLMSNPLTAEVERIMLAAQALSHTARKEPVDSVYGELEFLRHLYTCALAHTLSSGDDAAREAQEWIRRADEFRAKHIHTWMPDFMEMTIKYSRIPFYRDLARISIKLLEA